MGVCDCLGGYKGKREWVLCVKECGQCMKCKDMHNVFERRHDKSNKAVVTLKPEIAFSSDYEVVLVRELLPHCTHFKEYCSLASLKVLRLRKGVPEQTQHVTATPPSIIFSHASLLSLIPFFVVLSNQ
jgi:Zn-dependent alcohol dehydrogenase